MEQASDFLLRHSPLARRLTLRVRDDGRIVVTAPPGLPYHLAERFVSENEQWISQQRQKISFARQELTQSRQTILWQGKTLPWRLTVNRRQHPRVVREKDALVVFSPVENDQEVRKLLEKWFIGQAKEYFPERTFLLADVLGVEVKTVAIRSQRTRWGSCSGRRTISLNWRLMMTPIEVSDYVIYHELCHITHPNHSAAFWRSVADVFPNFKESRRWLNQHHRLLHF